MPASAPQNASQIKDVHDRTSSCGQVAHSESWYYLRVGAPILPKEMVLETMTTGLTPEERTEMIAMLKEHLLSRQQEQPMMIEAKANEPESESCTREDCAADHRP